MSYHTTIIDTALAKYPNAKKIAVSNFTMGYHSLSMEALLNLDMDTKLYNWNKDTVNAIKFVLSHKNKIG